MAEDHDLDFTQDLNPAQAEAVRHGDGPMLVLAGAGSGKTRVIVHRIARLVRRDRVVPWQILAVTFTNKAAGEMRDRLERLLGPAALELWVQTFHAFGARFLRREAAAAGLPPAFAIYDDDDQVRLVKRLLAELGVEDGEPFTPRQALSRIDRWKNAAVGPVEASKLVGGYDADGRLAVTLYEKYEAALKRAGAVDFGDLLLLPVKLLEADERLRARWAGRFRYVLVDEFQDTNPVQYRLLQLLAAPRMNVCVVGDDDQAIYRWRGADVNNILGFDKDFPGAVVVKLEQNYRSSKTILDAAHGVISRARRRREKKLWTESEAGAPLALLVGGDETEEAEAIARAIKAEHARGTPWDDIAVLYRTNAQSRALETTLRAERVPAVVVRGMSFYDRAEVKDAAAYLRLALNPSSDLDLERVVNRPPRGIGDKTVERLRAFASAGGVSLYDAIRELVSGGGGELKPAARRSLGEFAAIIESLNRDVAGLDAGIAVQEALKRSGLMARLDADHSDEAVERAENLAELVGAARVFDESLLGEPASTDPEEVRPPPLARFLEQVALLGDADAPTPEGSVALMTLHAAKGLEFEAVFLAGLEDGTLPHERPWSDQTPTERAEAEDEERRLCYVGMTRAKKRLTLSLARRRMGFSDGGASYRQTEPSRFLRDLPPDLFGESVAREVRAREQQAAQARAPVIRRHPGSLEGEPHIELDGADGFDGGFEGGGPGRPGPRPLPRAEAGGGPRGGARAGARGEPTVDYSFDQRAESAGAAFARGERVTHPSLGEGTVLACEGSGANAKATVLFDDAGEKRVVARFLGRA